MEQEQSSREHRADSKAESEDTEAKDWSKWPNAAGFNSWYEQKTPVQLKVTGKIPAYASGTLYRTGPSAYKVDLKNGGEFAMSHWFDGLSKVHRFVIDANGEETKVFYNSRSNVDKLIQSIKETGSLKGVTFAQKQDPCQNFFRKIMSTFEAMGPRAPDPGMNNIGVTLSVNPPGLTPPSKDDKDTKRHGSPIHSLWAQTDASGLKQLDPSTLEPIGLASQANLHPSLKGPLSAAHSQSDPLTGDVYNFNLSFGATPTYRIFRTSASTGSTSILATFPAKAAYIHSFFLTSDHVVLCVFNSHIKANGLSILYNKNILDSISAFDASQPARWYVVDRRHGRGLLATYESPALFAFHTVNAWTEPATSPSPSDAEAEETDIVCEVATYPSLDILHKLYYENLLALTPTSPNPTSCPTHNIKPPSTLPSLTRYRLPCIPSSPPPHPTTLRAKIDSTAPSSSSPELPTINAAYLTRPHRYTYGILDTQRSSLADAIVKWDSLTRTSRVWRVRAHTPGEPVFIAEPDEASGASGESGESGVSNGEEAKGQEDAGVLLSVVLDGIKGTSYLLCLDARDLSELGRAEVEGVVGFGFHGVHVGRCGAGGVEAG